MIDPESDIGKELIKVFYMISIGAVLGMLFMGIFITTLLQG